MPSSVFNRVYNGYKKQRVPFDEGASMIEVLPDMPESVTGIRVAGRLHGDDLHAFAWVVPGELALFHLDELDRAKEWAAG